METYRVVELSDDDLNEYLCCLKSWDQKFSSSRKDKWYQKKREKGLCVKLIKDCQNNVLAMIQYLPSYESFVIGDDTFLVLCLWVHGYDRGVGNVQARGLGTVLLSAAETEVMLKGARGLAAWGMTFEEWMPVSWYIGHGYQEVDRIGARVLVWKEFRENSSAPVFRRQLRYPKPVKDRVLVSLFNDGWCQDYNIACDLTASVVKDYGRELLFREYDTSDRAVMAFWGIDNAIFIDRELIIFGPDSIEKQLRGKIEERIKALKLGN